MNKELISNLFLNKDANVRGFAFKYLLTKSKGLDSSLIKDWFDSIRKFGYKSGDIDSREVFVLFNFSNKYAKENFKYLINFYSELDNKLHQNDFFILIYMASIEIQKLYIDDLKQVLNQEQLTIIEDIIEEYNSFKDYKLDELFLALISLLKENDEFNFIDLNHRLIETIIDLIVKFPATEVSAYIEYVLGENIDNYYLNSYLFYINAHLDGFTNSDDLMEIIIEKFSTVKFTILEQSFFVRPIKKLAYKFIEKDFQNICLFKYFSNKDIMSFYDDLVIKYGKQELFLEYFVKLFSSTLHNEGLVLSGKWIKEGLVKNREVILNYNLAVKMLEL